LTISFRYMMLKAPFPCSTITAKKSPSWVQHHSLRHFDIHVRTNDLRCQFIFPVSFFLYLFFQLLPVVHMLTTNNHAIFLGAKCKRSIPKRNKY
jgi:hypothetical protein